MTRTSRTSAKKRHLGTEDLFKLQIPTSISMSPDENKIAYTAQRMNKKDNKYYSNIFVHNVADNSTNAFTHGKNEDGKAVWSPDGSQLAFVSTREKKKAIYLIPSTGGSEKKIIELDGAIDSLQWTPDGKHLVFGLRYNDSHFISDKKKKKEPPVFRHVTRLFFRLDGLGYLPADTFQVCALDLSNNRLRRITKGKRDNIQPTVSPDGRWIAFVSNRQKNQDLEFLKQDLFVVPFKGSKERKIETPAGPVDSPKFSPDGKSIAYGGHANPNEAWGVTNLHIWKVGFIGGPKARDLMPRFDRCCYDQTLSDVGEPCFSAEVTWAADSKRIFFVSSDTGSSSLYSIPAAGGKPTRIFGGKCHVKGYSLNGRTKRAALIFADIKNPGDIFTCPTSYGAEKKAVRHTEFNKFLRTEIKLGRTREVMFRSFDQTTVQGWLLLPPNFKPGRRYPSILQIHGGPRCQYGHTFFHEMQYLAARGYVVFYTNPRGGQGRGETWADAITGTWGDLDYKDCMAAADWMEQQSFIHPKKMGVTGGSYGGYMTNWIIGHTHRFAAAVTQRSISDFRSFMGSSDIGWDLDRELDGWPWTNPDNWEKRSPITHFKNVKTPVLIIHSEQDLRCHIEQADQMFVRLKMLKKTVEMVRFPEEPHGLSRDGRPDRRIARLEWIAKWFDKYLK